ncbi:MAG: hypothetical protein KGP29_07600 [Proteobacteria bacterium]|nr:hypothetical protein [Pseudomonadota bacterium]
MKSILHAAFRAAGQKTIKPFSQMPEGLKIGLFGRGNMVGAIFTPEVIRDLHQAGNEIFVFGTKVRPPEELEGVTYCSLNNGIFPKDGTILDIGVSGMKPQVSQKELVQYSKFLDEKSVLCSVEAGSKMSSLLDRVSNVTSQCIRLMPNANVPRALVAYSTTGNVKESSLGAVRYIFERFGKLFPVSEERMNPFTGVAGSGPAYAHHTFSAIARSLNRWNEDRYPTSKAERFVLEVALNFDDPLHKRGATDRVKLALTKLEEKGSVESIILDAFEELGKDCTEDELKAFTAGVISRVATSMVKGAELCGFSQEMSEEMIIGHNGIIKASANKALSTGKSPARLKWEVTSVEGATQEGLARAEVGTGRTLDQLWSQAMQFAVNRSKQLGDTLGYSLEVSASEVEKAVAEGKSLMDYRKSMAFLSNAFTQIFEGMKKEDDSIAKFSGVTSKPLAANAVHKVKSEAEMDK